MRKIELYDGATPSANAVMAKNLLYLGIVFEQNSWVEQAKNMIITINEAVQKYPTSFGVWASTYLCQAYGINEITITGENIQPVLKQVLEKFLPNKILQSSLKENYENFPMLKNKVKFGESKIYLCRNSVCFPPFSNVSQLFFEIKNLSTK